MLLDRIAFQILSITFIVFNSPKEAEVLEPFVDLGVVPPPQPEEQGGHQEAGQAGSKPF